MMSSKFLASLTAISLLTSLLTGYGATQPLPKIGTCSPAELQYDPAPVTIGPYLNKDRLFDGSELLINTPSIREDARLLLAQAKLFSECISMGIPEPTYPRLVFSGLLEGQGSFTEPYSGKNINNINFTGAELDTYVQGNSWVSGYMALAYDSADINDSSKVFLNRAFITIGNLTKLPVYTTIGQIYVPFGRYSSGMVTSPTTLGLGRVRARALVLGYQQTGQNALHAEAYGYQGLTHPLGSNATYNQWGSDLGYAYHLDSISGEIGTSYISNLGDSQGIQANLFTNQNETQRHNVPAYDAYGSLSFHQIVLIAEYLSALGSFQYYDMNYINRGAKPQAFHTEANFNFHTGTKPSSIGVGYDHTVQALAVGLPLNSYEVFYNVNVWKNTNFALEYRHDKNYPTTAVNNDRTNPTSTIIVSNLGKTDNIVTAQFDLFF